MYVTRLGQCVCEEVGSVCVCVTMLGQCVWRGWVCVRDEVGSLYV